MGATTIWERWDGIKTDSTFQSPSMNSFNHYAYGAIGEWLFKEVAGIKNTLPGYKEIKIQPYPGGGLKYARAIQKTPYGLVTSEWSFDDDNFCLNVTIPANTTAEVVLPYTVIEKVKLDGNMLTSTNISITGQEDKVVISIGSGRYSFSYPAEGFPETARPGAGGAVKGSFDNTSLVADLLAHKPARDILSAELPVLMNSPWLSQVMNFPLYRTMEVLPDELKVSDLQIRKIDDLLKGLASE
jgi:hypothetical protein